MEIRYLSRLINQSKDPKMVNSSLTEKTEHVNKGDPVDPVLLSGNQVMEDSGKMNVTSGGCHFTSLDHFRPVGLV